MIERILLSTMSVVLCVAIARGGITATGDVLPPGPSGWDASTDAYIGKTGVGGLTVDAGSDLFSDASYLGFESTAVGSVTVSGAGSSWAGSRSLTVGLNGAGTLDVAAGASVSNTSGYIGASVGSSGSAIVSGANSTWANSSTLDVGRSGNGSLTVTSGGFVSNTNGYIGYFSASTSSAIISVGSIWSNSIDLYAGYRGSGSLSVTNKGSVNSRHGYIGHWAGSTGAATVNGVGSAWVNSEVVSAGFWGSGTLGITNGGLVSGEYGYIGFGAGSTGEATVRGAGSAWTNSESFYVGFLGDGSLLIADGGLVSVGGVMTIDDNGGGDSFVDMGGGGMLAVNGDADDSLLDFLGLIGGTDAIRYWDQSAWDWADLSGAAAGADYTLAYLTTGDLTGYTMLTVTAPAPRPGDTNRDFVVCQTDYGNLIAQFGGAPCAESADFDGDGFVGLEDFAVQRDNFGYGVYGATTAPDAGPAATTPEPASLFVVTIAGLPVLLKRKRS